MTEAPKFLLNLPPEKMSEDALLRLKRLVDQYKFIKSDIEEVELKLKEKKEYFNKLSQEEIPTLLNTFGLAEIKLVTGEKIKVKEDASVSVPDDKKEAFYAFLKERNEEDIIKLHFHFSRMPVEKMTELFSFLTEQDYDYSSDRGVHAQTLKKYFKELLGIGDEEREKGIVEGRYLRKEDIENIANVFVLYRTYIK